MINNTDAPIYIMINNPDAHQLHTDTPIYTVINNTDALIYILMNNPDAHHLHIDTHIYTMINNTPIQEHFFSFHSSYNGLEMLNFISIMCPENFRMINNQNQKAYGPWSF